MTSSKDTQTATPDTPHWAIEQETQDIMPGAVMHRGEKLTWGNTSVWLERLDVNGKPSEVDVMITTRTNDYPDEEIAIPLTSAGEVMVQLTKLFNGLTVMDVGREYSKLT
ncbi:MAG: hypothetical protein K0R99_4760 [Microbacterium sp.]|jgi:hypothetical protein|uniref:hypothetical protein n=1 Tax=Microbacterium sp. TaxID=51671 RepID=UPI0026371472|nr:hypothetical protein [Microbacterium sp.]MDF2563314.1 hypothetical protein [Microbacterium sp.]